MSKIFEALQYAQLERLQREQTAQRPLAQAKQEARTVNHQRVHSALKADAPSRCHCKQHSARVRRQGITDFLCRSIGLYPWQCFKCGRRFHLFRRYVT